MMKPGGARNKGADAEREVIKLLEPIVRECGGGMLFRNLDQTRCGGHDIIGLDWLALEVKRQETLDIEAWWAQTVKQAGTSRVPVLVYRQSRKPWQVMMQGGLNGRAGRIYPARVTVSFWDFQNWVRRELLSSRQGMPLEPSLGIEHT